MLPAVEPVAWVARRWVEPAWGWLLAPGRVCISIDEGGVSAGVASVWAKTVSVSVLAPVSMLLAQVLVSVLGGTRRQAQP